MENQSYPAEFLKTFDIINSQIELLLDKRNNISGQAEHFYYGVPQKNILGPILLSIYIADVNKK